MTLGEILACDDVSFVNDITADYIIYQKYSLADYKTIFPEFINFDILKKFKIIKYMLSNKNNSEIPADAGILFQLCKESKNGSIIASDIIYKNLRYNLQQKLAKTSVDIKKEIKKLTKIDTDDIDLTKQIVMNKNMPNEVKKNALKKINEMKLGGSEYHKQLLYVKALIEYPWIGKHDSDIFTRYVEPIKWKEIIQTTRDKLNDKIYGHKESKNFIDELLCKWFSNPNSMGKSLALEGPPGVGKTMLAQELGKSLGLPFSKINLGGVEDPTILNGSAGVYSGSSYGLIIKKMTEMKSPRCILFFDELDKVAFHNGKNEISDVLIHVTDSTTNSQFDDKFFQDITFPLNKVLFIFSFNSRKNINPILLERMELIECKSYSIEDKIQIVKNHLLREIQEDIGLKEIDIKISDNMITHLIDSYTNESGVRAIKKVLDKILRKINKDKIFCTGIFNKSKNIKSIELTQKLIDSYLEKQNINIRKIHAVDEIGVINGLYVSGNSSGGILPILIYKNQTGNGKFVLNITGNQKRVMKESINFAYTIATNIVKQKFVKKFLKNYPDGLHLHNPDSSEKDGPSSGICTTLAFISKILDIKIKRHIAITGECDMNGNVSEIGGIPEKLTGAKKAGVKLCFVPNENKKDIEKLKDTHKSLIDVNFKVICVSNIKEILEFALIENIIEYNDLLIYEKTFNCDKYLVDKCSDFQEIETNIIEEKNEEENEDENEDENEEENEDENEEENDDDDE
jgi:endopeptidase La